MRGLRPLALGVALLLAGCAAPAPTPTPTSTPLARSSPGFATAKPAPSTPPATASPTPVAILPSLPTMSTGSPRPTATAACQPTDQDHYVYNPGRLAVVAACIRVTGTVEAVRSEADGDLHILVALDPPYGHLLTPANQGEELGDLVVEPVCVREVTQADAIATCQRDRDPLTSFPSVGMHIWLEGRYVHDLEHGGWSELHPLYRWGRA
jgi:hypothetical protein